MRRLLTFNSIIALVLIFVVSSCMSNLDLNQEPVETQSELHEIDESQGGENERRWNFDKKATRFYFERFSNQLDPRQPNGDRVTSPDDFALFFPGVGEGNATFMGKALTFINQQATIDENGQQGTIAAPVTQFYADELAALGIKNIPDEVSSITSDKRGNSVWFKNIGNAVTPISEIRFNFEAEVEIIGGTGRFDGATGKGKVRGFFNPTTGEGSSIIIGKIQF